MLQLYTVVVFFWDDEPVKTVLMIDFKVFIQVDVVTVGLIARTLSVPDQTAS